MALIVAAPRGTLRVSLDTERTIVVLLRGIIYRHLDRSLHGIERRGTFTIQPSPSRSNRNVQAVSIYLINKLIH